jgi:amino acid adenylation domain-containing protein
MSEHSFEAGRACMRFSSGGFAKGETEQTIHLRFERMAEEFGDRTAIKTGNSQLTYVELNRLANRISRIVAAKCDEETARVALLLSHDAVAMAAMIGVLKSGGAYIPIDPSFPPARIQFMVENARASLIVAHNRTIAAARMITGGRTEVLNIDEIGDGISDENPLNPVGPDSYAYILYTSGSTGKPKGVIHTHRNLLHQIYCHTRTVGVTASDRLSLIPSYCVGAAHVDIYAALLNGATLFPVSVKEKSIQQLIDLLVTEEITIYHSVPTLFRHITNYLTRETAFPKLRVINLGGESVNTRDIELFRTHFTKNTIFVNSLACTEAGVFAQYFVDHDAKLNGNRVPSGYPTEDMEIVLFDEQSDGNGDRVGEIAIKSRYLSPGYWQSPDMTKAAFKSLPDCEGTFLYGTGDLGRIRSDGLLEHIGRKDFQIKIRGFRVEPEEIEAVLGLHPRVKESAVVAREEEAGNKILVAYAVFSKGPAVLPAELRNFLKEKLPDYMLPSVFVELDSLPLTPSGKVDRKALPPPGNVMPGLARTFVAPRNKLEAQLTGIWEEVFSIRPIGVTDNFFELGGHSLLAIRLASEIKKILKNNFPVIAIYQFPTIEQIAEMLNGEVRSRQFSSLVKIKPGEGRQPFFWVHGVTSFSLLPRYLESNRPLYGLIHQGLDGIISFTSLDEISSHYLKAMRTVQPKGPYLLGGYCSGGMIALDMAQKLLRAGEGVPLLFLVDPPRQCFSSATFTDISSSKNGTYSSGVLYHSRKIALMSPGHKIAYTLRKLSTGFKMIRRFIAQNSEKEIKLAICSFYRFFGRPMPLSLREFYLFENIYKNAIQKYTPKLYKGKILLCHSDQVSYGDSVRHITSGEAEIHQIIGADHHSILKEPHVRIWAEHLNQHLRDLRLKREDDKSWEPEISLKDRG